MTKVPVSASAVFQRAKRHIAADGELLKTARDGSATQSLGPFYTVNKTTNMVERSQMTFTDLCKMVLKPHEVLAD